MTTNLKISCGPETQEAKRPNLAFVLADQLRHDWLGYTGDARAKTPNLDRLAARIDPWPGIC